MCSFSKSTLSNIYDEVFLINNLNCVFKFHYLCEDYRICVKQISQVIFLNTFEVRCVSNVYLEEQFLEGTVTNTSQIAFTCSESTIETLENVWNMFKVDNKTLERRRGRLSGVFINNFAHISYLFVVFLLVTLNKEMLVGLYNEALYRK